MKRTTNGNRKPFFYQTAWYVKLNGRKEYLCPGTDDEKAEYRKLKAKAAKGKPARLPIPDRVWTAYHETMALDPATIKEQAERVDVRTLAQLYINDAKARGRSQI